jgi:anthranilate phosphoribosyltransferase
MARQDLSRPETEQLFGSLMDGGWSDIHKTGLLVALTMKGEAASEIAGAALAMRGRVVRIPHHQEDAVDTCGTGGDGKGTFNISTAAAIVAAAAGVPIAKHGNRSVSSRSGSADVLEALGVKIAVSPETAGRGIDEIGIAFLFAPGLHPAMKEVMPVRKALAVRTIFNLLGPLTNPAGARRQVMGVYARELVGVIGEVQRELGAEHALVVHGEDGLDEITVTGKTAIAEVHGDEIRTWELDPADYGARVADPADLRGGTPEENAAALRGVLEGGVPAGRLQAFADVTVLNAGAAVYVGGRADSLRDGVEAARAAIASGAALEKLDASRGLSDES